MQCDERDIGKYDFYAQGFYGLIWARRLVVLSLLGLFLLTYLLYSTPVMAQDGQCGMSDDERQLAYLIQTAANQNRPYMACDPILHSVALIRATDMGARDYFGHVSPSGYGPNHLVEAYGYSLPDWWGDHPSSNYVESIAAGFSTPQAAFDALMASSGHRTHLLALMPFYQDQVRYGIGIVAMPNSRYGHYIVIITAPEAGG